MEPLLIMAFMQPGEILLVNAKQPVSRFVIGVRNENLRTKLRFNDFLFLSQAYFLLVIFSLPGLVYRRAKGDCKYHIRNRRLVYGHD